MAHRMKGKGCNTRREILASANRLFRVRGISSVTVSAVMEGVGLTVGGFYSHFTSKEELAEEVCAQSFSQALAAWRTEVESADDAGQSPLEGLMKMYIDHLQSHHCPVLTLGFDTGGETRSDAFVECYRRGTLALLDTFVATGTAAGIVREQALMLFAAMLGIGFLSKVHATDALLSELNSALLGQPRQPPCSVITT